MNLIIRTAFVGKLMILLVAFAKSAVAGEPIHVTRPNVLFIAVDDLACTLG